MSSLTHCPPAETISCRQLHINLACWESILRFFQFFLSLYCTVVGLDEASKRSDLQSSYRSEWQKHFANTALPFSESVFSTNLCLRLVDWLVRVAKESSAKSERVLSCHNLALLCRLIIGSHLLPVDHAPAKERLNNFFDASIVYKYCFSLPVNATCCPFLPIYHSI